MIKTIECISQINRTALDWSGEIKTTAWYALASSSARILWFCFLFTEKIQHFGVTVAGNACLQPENNFGRRALSIQLRFGLKLEQP